MKHLSITKTMLVATGIFIAQLLAAQKKTYPGKETVLNDVKTRSALEQISRIYGSALGWDKIRLDFSSFASSGERTVTFFYDYQSTLAKKGRLDYNDMSDVQVIATTPRNSEEKYFEIVLDVTYTCYGGVIPAAKWTFKEANVKSGNFHESGGSYAMDKKRVDEIMPALRNYKGAKATTDKIINYDIHFWENGELDVVTIDSIYVNKGMRDDNLSSQRFKNFLIACTFVRVDGPLAYYPGSIAELQVGWELQGTKWNIVSYSVKGITVNESKKTTKLDASDSPDKSYKRITRNGFNDVYKTKSAYTRSLYTESELEKFSAQITKAIRFCYEKPEEGKAAIEALVDPSLTNAAEVVNSYYNPLTNARKYLCELKDNYINLNAWKEDDSEKPGKQKIVIGSQSLFVTFYREGADTDKELQKKYKEAGISKESMKNHFGGKYDNTWKTDLNIVFKNNRWYITEKASEPVKMD